MGRRPGATYRLQLQAGFGFDEARALLDYLRDLGITDLYASPILAARAGSTHGYDVVDPLRINPALGGDEALARLTDRLRELDMGLLLDIVPNHMAVGAENPWWQDVLTYGVDSPYASFFDIVWDEPPNRLILPVLGDSYAAVLERGELTLERVERGFVVRYYEHEFPVAPRTWGRILGRRSSALDSELGRQHDGVAALHRLLRGIEALEEPAPEEGGVWPRGEALRHGLQEIVAGWPQVAAYIDEGLRQLNGRPGEPASFDGLDQLLDAQAYRLAYWRLASERMGYRRFFDNTDLIGMRVEDGRVFELTHRTIGELVRAGKVTGLRVDHIDGLWDPQAYLERLRGLGGADDLYVVVEKILSGREHLPERWPVAGTTGYEFSRALDDMMVDARGLQVLNRIYGRFIGGQPDFDDLVYATKKTIGRKLFGGEMARLARRLRDLAVDDRYGRDLPWEQLERAIEEVSICLPVYRTYLRPGDLLERDRAFIEEAVAEARRRAPEVQEAAFAYVRRVLLLDGPERHRPAWLEFVQRWQQLTSPLTAKGIEDTALYVYNRLLSLNSVGGEPEPEESDLTVEAFHQHNLRERQAWPHGLNSTSTHDSKRSEDVRARLHVLSEVTTSWARALTKWRRLNARFKRRVGDLEAPDHNEEYLLYQTLLGVWPLDPAELEDLEDRVKAYVVKAAREAKVHTSWREQNDAYEAALVDFVGGVLSADNAEFLTDFRKFHERIAYFGAMSSLSIALLKITAPGVPDFYQGTELWTFTLVDPDNRRPVDFARRRQLLASLREAAGRDDRALARELLANWQDGRIKMHVLQRALAVRNQHPDLFAHGTYHPLAVAGQRRKRVCAFARRHDDTWCLVATPVRVARFTSPDSPPIGRRIWKNTTIKLPADAPTRWRHALTGELLETRDNVLDLHRALATVPLLLATPA